MNIVLDVDGRFVLSPSPPGYRLSVDGGRAIVHCRNTAAALAYVTEMISGDRQDGDVIAGLSEISAKVDYARRVLDAVEVTRMVTRVIRRISRHEKGVSRRDLVASACLEISGCPNVDVFRKSDQAKEVSGLAKAIVDTWSSGDEGSGQEAAVNVPTEKLAQGLRTEP